MIISQGILREQDSIEAWLNGTIRAAINCDATQIRQSAFYNCSLLTMADLPVCSSVGVSAFA